MIIETASTCRSSGHPTRRWIVIVALGCLCNGCAGLASLERSANVAPPIGVVHEIPVAKPMTLPRFLGIDGAIRRTVLLGQVVREKTAIVVPALEPKPLALPVSHPANEHSASPAVVGAHKVKKAKAAAAAKVKAIAILAGEDCGSNPHVEEGILAALDDASPEVRIAAIEAVLQSRRGCDSCCGGCCSEPIRAKLTTMVFEKTGPNCWLEPSSKARRLARLALDACGGPAAVDACACEAECPVEVPAIEVINEIYSTEP